MQAGKLTLAAWVGVCAAAWAPPARPAGAADAPLAATKAAATQEKKMSDRSTYPVAYASPRRHCAIQAATSAKGEVAFSRPTGPLTGEAPYSLLVWDGHIVVVRKAGLALFDQDGRLLWQRTRQTGSPPAVGNGLLYYENAKCNLDAVDLKNVPALDNVPLPSAMNAEFLIQLFWPRAGDFVAVAYWPGREPDQAPQLGWDVIAYGKRICERGGSFREPEQLPPLFVPQSGAVILCTQEVICVDTEEENETVRFKLPLAKATDWSADAAGTLCLLGYQGQDKAMVAVTPAGQEKWRWLDRQKADLWAVGQPPIRAGEKRVYALTGNRVLAIEAGKLLWQYDIKDEVVRSATALADGSLLVAAGKKLIHLDPAGKMLFSVAVEKDIQAPPVVDAEGGIYFVAGVYLVKIQ
jgi:hypothetical protein